MAIRLHLDEHLSPAIADALRSDGVDVTTSQEAGLLGQDDNRQISFATLHGRTLVTCDDHFLRHDFVERAPHGICYCHPSKYSLGEFIGALLIVAECMEDEEMRYSVHWL